MGFRKRLASKVFAVVTALTLAAVTVFGSAISASAAGTASDEVKENEKGVVWVECLYVDGVTQYHVLSMTGFLINSQTVVTGKEILGYNYEQALTRNVGQNFVFDESKIRFKVKIGDAYVDATSKFKDTKMQFAVMQLSQSIDLEKSTYKALVLGDSNAVETTQTIYSIGYSTDNIWDVVVVDEVSSAISEEKTVINEGKVTRIEEETKFIQFAMSNPINGFIGGPVINEAGDVVALTFTKKDDGYIAVPIQKVKDVCNNFGIPYEESSGTVAPVVDSKPDSQPAVDSKPTEDSKPAIDSTPVEESKPALDSKPSEESKPVVPAEDNNNNMIIIIVIVGIAVVVVILIIVMIVLLTKKKPAPAAPVPPPARPGTYPGSMPPPATQPQLPPQPPMAPPQPPMAPPQPPMGGYNQPPMNPAQGAGETTVLSDGAGETTVLGGGATVGIPSGVLVNTKSGEKIIINKPEFAIGKERSRVDYCIADDNSVSRLHVKIRVRAGRCYVVDMGSKNGTYINGNKLTPNQEVLIQNGDKLKISLIEFEFKG